MKAGSPKRPTVPVTFATVRDIALALPEVEEGTAHGTPAFRVRGKLFARLREDGDSLVIRVDLDTRDALLQANSPVFFITEHYRRYPLMLIRLSAAHPDVLREWLQEAWRQSAPPRLVATHFGGRP